jgi:exosortase/archaeosortase family protein
VDFSTGKPVSAGKSGPLQGLLLRAGTFLLLFALLQVSWDQSRGGIFEYAVIHDGTVRPAAALVRLITPDIQATPTLYSVQAKGGGLNIRNGCEGIEALFLLLAAFAVAPIEWRRRITGVTVGIAVVFIVNQLRVLTLFYAWRADHSLFDVLHGTVTPIAVILLVSAYYYLWLASSARAAAPT